MKKTTIAIILYASLLTGCSGEAELFADIYKLSSKIVDMVINPGGDEEEKTETAPAAGPGGAKQAGKKPAGVTEDIEKIPELITQTKETLHILADYAYNPVDRRDPFRSMLHQKPSEKAAEEVSKDPLMNTDLTQMKMVASIWGKFGYKALIETPDGKGYIVEKGTGLGLNKGVVKIITGSKLVIEEKFTDALGEVRSEESEIKLHEKEK